MAGQDQAAWVFSLFRILSLRAPLVALLFLDSYYYYYYYYYYYSLIILFRFLFSLFFGGGEVLFGGVFLIRILCVAAVGFLVETVKEKEAEDGI